MALREATDWFDRDRPELVDEHVGAAAEWLATEMTGRYRDVVCTSHARGHRLESPLEAVLVVWVQALTLADHIHNWRLREQVEVRTRSGKTYRVDFRAVAFDPYESCLTRKETDLDVVVEVDGHNWHERTREQVAARDARDRELQASGFTVLHFSFAELTADPLKCIYEISGAVHGEIGRRLGPAYGIGAPAQRCACTTEVG